MTTTQKHSQPGRFLAAFYLCFTVVAFSSIETMINPIRNEIAPMLINFWRFFIGTAILLPTLIVFKRHQIRHMTREDLRDLSLIGFLNIFLSMGAFALCVKYSKASTAAILISANPLATNFFSWLILKEKMTGKRIIALSLGLLGIIALTLRADTAVDTPTGIAAGIVAMTGFGLYTVLSKKLIEKHGSLTVTVTSCLPALIMYFPVLYIFDIGFWPPEHTWPNILGAGIIGTGLGYLTFMKSLEFLSAGKASYLFFFKPPVAMLFAWFFLKEQMSGSAVAGTMLIMTGILTEIKRAGPKPEAALNN